MTDDTESLETQFTYFLEDFGKPTPKYGIKIAELPVKGLRSLTIDFTDIYTFDVDLAQDIIDDPEPLISIFESVVRSKLRTRDPAYADSIDQINVRFRYLPLETPLREIGADHICKLIMTQGIIVRAAAVQPLLIDAMFRCPVCGDMNKLAQRGLTLKKPETCLACDNRKGFELVPKESVFVDSQTLTIQECPEELPPGQLPRSLKVELRHDLVNIARPGDRVTLTGFIKLLPCYGRGGELRTFEIQLDTNYLEVSSREREFLELSSEDEEMILALAKEPDIFQNLLNSFAPSIYGYKHIKESILYLLFGGVSKRLPDLKIRGDLNILLVGDPGTAKSQMLQYTSRVSPRGLFTTGRGSTAAGLTAAVVKEGGTGSFVLEAGALVLADKGVCCIDEFEKMRDEDRGALHPAMEQQIVPIAKGGIVATLNARTSILAAANPTLGRYNPYQNILQNLGNLPVTLLSRFDLIFILKDIPDREADTNLAEHILTLHMLGEAAETPSINQDLLQKYIGYAKRINPKITTDVKKLFTDFFVQMRASSTEGDEKTSISITARQLESLVRLAEARARAHLRTEVSVEDAEAAINLMRKSLEQVGLDLETGQIDIDILYSGKPRSLQAKLQKLLQVVSEMERISGSVRDDDLYESLQSDHGIGRAEGGRLIGVLMKDGTIYSPRPGYYRRTT